MPAGELVIGNFKDGIIYINKDTPGLLYDTYYDNENSVNFLNVRIFSGKEHYRIGNVRSVIII
jgi:hypothetical protein